MARSSEPPPALVLAAQQLEDELRRCEEAVAEATKARLNTEKNITRAARALKAAAEHREQIGAKVNALLAAIKDAGARADAAASRMEARAADIRARMDRLHALQSSTGEIVAAVREAGESAKQAKTAAELVDRLGPVEQRIDQVLQEVRADEFDDVAHDLAALKEMVAAMRRKLQAP